MRKVLVIAVLTFAFVLFFIKCSEKECCTDMNNSKVIEELKIDIDNFYKAAKELNVESIIAFFNSNPETIHIVNGNYFSNEDFKNLLETEYSKRENQQFVIEEPIFNIISNDAALVITKKANEFKLKDGITTIRYTVETMLWKKTNGKWKIDVYNGYISTFPDDKYKKSIENAVIKFAKELSSQEIKKDDCFNKINDFLNKNHFIFGSAIALNEVMVDGKTEKYCVYIYKDNNLLKEIVFSEADFTTAEWFATPMQMKNSFWTNVYFDKPGCKNTVITFSVPIFKPNTTEIIGIVTGDALIGQ